MELEFIERLELLRELAGKYARIVKEIATEKRHKDFWEGEETFEGEHSEIKADLALVSIHFEEAKMGIEKIMKTRIW